MEEKDLEKMLDTMIIDGLIKEAEQDNADFEYAMSKILDEDFDEIVTVPDNKRFSIKPWIYSLSAAAAILICVLVPADNMVNGKLCDSALIASSSYMTSTKGGFDLNTATKDQIRAELSTLEANYTQAADDEEKREAGWILAQAYLKLHKKGDAVKVLKELNENFGNGRLNEFGNPYQELLDILD